MTLLDNLFWKMTLLKEGLRSMLLFNSNFDRIALLFFTNDEDERGEVGQRSYLLMKK